MLGVLIYQAMFTDQVNITTTAPATVNAGTEFTVELMVNKGNIGGFAKLQQDLPEGFTAVSGEAKGGEFSFDKQQVKFIWMALPGDASVKVTYKVKVNSDVSGDKLLAGKFSFIENNAKQSVEIAPVTIKVEGGSQPVATNNDNNTNTNTNTNTETNTNTGDNSTTATNTGENNKTTETNTGTGGNQEESNHSETVIGNVSSTRKMPEEVDADGSFKVEITINKGTITGYAKLQETLPEGFTATAGNVGNASFSFSEQKVRIVWLALPSDAEMKVSYNVKVDKGVAGAGMKSISGIFSYIENEETRKYAIAASTINVKDGGAVASGDPKNNDNTQAGGGNTQDNGTQAGAGNKTSDNGSAGGGNTGGNGNTQASNNTGGSGNTNNENASPGVNIPSPQTGVVYRVQLAALQNPKNANWFNSKFGIAGQVYTEMHEGFTKYTTGSFPMYKSARDERESIKGKGVSDAFVTAYNSGKRITVQEALMITTQQWYR